MMSEYFFIVQILLGLYLLLKGADFLVDQASTLAINLKMSQFLVGLIFVSIGTSLPELVVSVYSSWKGDASELIYANLMGSNLANVCLVLGVLSLFYPIKVNWSSIRRNWWINLAVIPVIFFLFDRSKVKLIFLDRWRGGVLLLLFLFYLYLLIKNRSQTEVSIPDQGEKVKSNMKHLIFILIGALMITLGGKLVVDGSIFMAQEIFQIRQGLVGFTILALGTSLPELVTSLMAGKKNSKGIALGNILGSNIFNLLWIMGISAVIHPIELPREMIIDLIACGFSLVLFFLLVQIIQKKVPLNYLKGIPLLVFYFGYLFYLFFRV